MKHKVAPITPNCYEANVDGSLTMYFEDIKTDVVYSGPDGKPDGTGNFHITIQAHDVDRMVMAGLDALKNAPPVGKVVRR